MCKTLYLFLLYWKPLFFLHDVSADTNAKHTPAMSNPLAPPFDVTFFSREQAVTKCVSADLFSSNCEHPKKTESGY